MRFGARCVVFDPDRSFFADFGGLRFIVGSPMLGQFGTLMMTAHHSPGLVSFVHADFHMIDGGQFHFFSSDLKNSMLCLCDSGRCDLCPPGFCIALTSKCAARANSAVLWLINLNN